jgi:hypothetical protein
MKKIITAILILASLGLKAQTELLVASKSYVDKRADSMVLAFNVFKKQTEGFVTQITTLQNEVNIVKTSNQTLLSQNTSLQKQLNELKKPIFFKPPLFAIVGALEDTVYIKTTL